MKKKGKKAYSQGSRRIDKKGGFYSATLLVKLLSAYEISSKALSPLQI
jgi:hypothetical protein